jgi:FkbM family methyltransferase
MNLRRFLSGVSSSFVVGTLGGISVGAIGTVTWLFYFGYLAQNYSYSEIGEDLIVAAIFHHLKIDKPTYLDIGAYDPIVQSNTYLLYRGGSRGVLVEPNSEMCSRLKRVRPGDTTLDVGIGITDAVEADYYTFAIPVLNTFDKEQAKGIYATYGDRAGPPRVTKKRLVNINKVIADHFGGKAPDFLSIDVEGLDYEILKSVAWDRYRPSVVCAEIDTGVTASGEKTTELMRSNGYSIWGRTPRNLIFVDDRRH